MYTNISTTVQHYPIYGTMRLVALMAITEVRLKLDRNKLLHARERLGYGIEVVGEKAGTAKNSVLRAEHEGDIRPSTARKIAKALGVEVADLIKEQDSPKTRRSSPKAPEDQGGEERRLLELIQPWVLLMETETVYWELLVSKGLVNRHFYQEARARREDMTEHLNTLLEDLAEEGFDGGNRRHRPSRRVRKKLQSTFNHWSWAFNAVGEAFFESLVGDELEEARALRDEDAAQEERLGDIYEILQARKTG